MCQLVLVIGFLGGPGLLLWGLSGLRRGRIEGKYGVHERKESPGLFWICVLSYLGVGAVLTATWVALFNYRGLACT